MENQNYRLVQTSRVTDNMRLCAICCLGDKQSLRHYCQKEQHAFEICVYVAHSQKFRNRKDFFVVCRKLSDCTLGARFPHVKVIDCEKYNNFSHLRGHYGALCDVIIRSTIELDQESYDSWK